MQVPTLIALYSPASMGPVSLVSSTCVTSFVAYRPLMTGPCCRASDLVCWGSHPNFHHLGSKGHRLTGTVAFKGGAARVLTRRG